ncbi:HD domain-containing protein [Amycolatopsis cynarae]|uniref:HD domain-containing protein n=1 Tax=Amycolatopsis cynarae TaxID=2995223 RepID=A0ABY7BAG2_9PSEU|nr:HD domain-containing protein [Amycolatopsis sp. HUAS 11-8]WAL69340.1 HD domain-containing protein [Amycolatopsis sp. HUAS 11-8]
MTTTLASPQDRLSRLDRRMRRLEARLAGGQDLVGPEVLHDWVEQARSKFDGAAVTDFVPVLIEREVRRRLRATQGEVDLVAWARETAQRLLATELSRRWAHTQGVARQAAAVAPALPPRDRPVLVASAWLHDIGYAAELAETGMHQLDGAAFLLRQGIPRRICALVAHHAGASAVADLIGLSGRLAGYADEHTAVRDALWYCDMTTSPDGEPVSFTKRMAELRARRGPDDPVVRALAANEKERAAAVRRTEKLLAAAAA